MVEYLLLEYLQFKDHGQMMKAMDGLLPSGVRFCSFSSAGFIKENMVLTGYSTKLSYKEDHNSNILYSIICHPSSASTETADVALMLSKAFRIGKAFRISSRSSSRSLQQGQVCVIYIWCVCVKSSWKTHTDTPGTKIVSKHAIQPYNAYQLIHTLTPAWDSCECKASGNHPESRSGWNPATL